MALYEQTGDAHWLDLARANADALDAQFREADGGVAYAWCPCVSGTIDRTRDTAAQAWAQHLEAALAEVANAPMREAESRVPEW